MKLKENAFKLLSLFLALILILGTIPYSIFADTTQDGGADDSNDKGAWHLKNGSNMDVTQYAGMRFSLYFAEGDWANVAEMESGIATVDFQEIGKIDTYQNGNPATIDVYTGLSVYERMHPNKSGKDKMKEHQFRKSSKKPYESYSLSSFGFNLDKKFVAGNEVQSGFLKIYTDTDDRDRYVRFFTGKTLDDFYLDNNPTDQRIEEVNKNWQEADITNIMKIVDKILADSGSKLKISTEDFKNGVLNTDEGQKQGVYKLYFEPIAKMTINRTDYAVTVRDIIAISRSGFKPNIQYVTGSGKAGTTDNLFYAFSTPFRNMGNAVFLMGSQENIRMSARTSRYERKSNDASNNPSSNYYKSAGVGVFTGYPKGGRPGPKIIRTYVQVEDLDENNNPIFKTIEESDIKPVEFYKDGNGFTTKIPKGIDIVDFNNEKGVAYLNDIIIVSAEDISLNPSSGKTIWENTTLPQNILEKDALIDGSGRLQLNPDAKDIPAHAFGLYTSTPAFIETFKEETEACF